MPMGMLCALIVKLESIVGLQDLPILRKTTGMKQWVSISIAQVNHYNLLSTMCCVGDAPMKLGMQSLQGIWGRGSR